jgi:hypothetical protein
LKGQGNTLVCPDSEGITVTKKLLLAGALLAAAALIAAAGSTSV